MNIESNKTQQPALVMPQNATPLTVADTLIRWCNDRAFIEDVMYYVECYYKRQTENATVFTPHAEVHGRDLKEGSDGVTATF